METPSSALELLSRAALNQEHDGNSVAQFLGKLHKIFTQKMTSFYSTHKKK
jgi:hypothetical protein